MKICKVLIVEDDSDIRELLSGTFAGEGYRFVMATNAAEMRSALASDPELDIVVVDLHLPGGANGLVLAAEAAASWLRAIIAASKRSKKAAIATL